MARLAVYGAVSTALATSVVLVAFAQRSNFYSACIYLYKSNACMMILLNLGLFLTVVLGQLVQWIFFGALRPLEVEHLYERAWYTITETCLAMTIFRDEFDTRFVVMFTVLLFLKVFHWLCQDRVDSMEQSPGLPVSFHVRMVSMMSFLIYLDVIMVSSAISHFILNPPNMMIMFAFEYTLLATSLAASFGKYILHTIDMRSEEAWENKSMLLFYLDLLADFVKLATYLMFFMVILIWYGLPVHIIRDVYMTLRSFLQKCKDLIQYRMATRNMNERYPDATPVDLAALSDPICIICREEMVCAAQPAAGPDANNGNNPPRPATPRSGASLSNVPKKLPCGHIFHFHCLKSWLERQQSCPTCRRMVLDPPTPGAGQAAGDAAAPAAAGAAGGAAGAAAAGVNGAPGAGFNANGQPNGAPGVPGQAAAQGDVQGQGHPPHGVGFPLFFGLPGHHLAVGGIHPYIMGGIPAGGPVAAANPAAPGGDARQPPGAMATGGNAAAVPNNVPTYTIPHITHPIPGLIPLFPVQHEPADQPLAGDQGSSQQQQRQQHSTATAGSSHPLTSSDYTTTNTAGFSGRNLAIDQIPLTSLDSLSLTQLQHLEENTRRGLQERLRILQAVDHQIRESTMVLSQVLGTIPSRPLPLSSLQGPSQSQPPVSRNTNEDGEASASARDPPSPDLTATAQGTAGPNGSMGEGRLYSTGIFGSKASILTREELCAKLGTPQSSYRTTTTASTSASHADTSATTTTTTTTSSSVISTTTVASPIPSTWSNVPLLSAVEAAADDLSSPVWTSTSAATETSLPLLEGAAGQTTTNVRAGDAVASHTNDSAVSADPAEPPKMDKGKGKKEEERQVPLEEGDQDLMASTLTATDLSDFEEEQDEEDDESLLSPQEMVRRRWVKLQQEQH